MSKFAFLTPGVSLSICVCVYLAAALLSHWFKWSRLSTTVILGLCGALMIPAALSKFQGYAQSAYWEKECGEIAEKIEGAALAAKERDETAMVELRNYFYNVGTTPYELDKLIAYVTEGLNESTANSGESYVRDRMNSLPERREKRKDIQEYNQRFINKLYLLWKPVVDMALTAFDSRVNAINEELEPVKIEANDDYELIVSKHETVPIRVVRFASNNGLKVVLYKAEVRNGVVITNLKLAFSETVDGRRLPTFRIDFFEEGFALNPSTPFFKDIDSGTITETDENSLFYQKLNEGLNRLFDDTYFNHL